GPAPAQPRFPPQLYFPHHIRSPATQKCGIPIHRHLCHRDLHSFPTRRSSDLVDPTVPTMAATSAPPSSLSARRRGMELARIRARSAVSESISFSLMHREFRLYLVEKAALERQSLEGP